MASDYDNYDPSESGPRSLEECLELLDWKCYAAVVDGARDDVDVLCWLRDIVASDKDPIIRERATSALELIAMAKV